MGKNSPIKLIIAVTPNRFAPGQCMILNNMPSDKQMADNIPTNTMNLFFKSTLSFTFKTNRSGKKIKLQLPIPKTSIADAPGQCKNLNKIPVIRKKLEIKPLINITFFIA